MRPQAVPDIGATRVRRAAIGPARARPHTPRVLFAAAEVAGLVKTGGLADVCAELPAALRDLGVDVTVCLPAYRTVLPLVGDLVRVGELALLGHRVGLLRGRLGPGGVPLILVDAPSLFDRAGDPYRDAEGAEFDDNALRFGVFCKALAAIATHGPGGAIGFDLVHLNDWHTGLAAPELAAAGLPSVFTIHNLAYQGMFARSAFERLELDPGLWRPDGVEAVGCLSFIKAGINFSSAITTVSPTYAREILTPAMGEGLHEVLGARADRLVGILNGVDARRWNPTLDPLIERTYGLRNVVEGKRANKRALQALLGLQVEDVPLVAFIGRLSQQKGIDALLDAAAGLAIRPVQIVVLATGERDLEHRIRAWSGVRSDQVAACLRHDEALVHLIHAGADILLMPSRFEPCGLSQMHAQRYGSVPVVHATGGLADTVVDASEPGGNGFRFGAVDGPTVLAALDRALDHLAHDRAGWRRLQRAGMRMDHSWARSARAYLEVYRQAIEAEAASPASMATGPVH